MCFIYVNFVIFSVVTANYVNNVHIIKNVRITEFQQMINNYN